MRHCVSQTDLLSHYMSSLFCTVNNVFVLSEIIAQTNDLIPDLISFQNYVNCGLRHGSDQISHG